MQPMFITLPDETPFAFAGLWEIWNSKGELDIPLVSCSILTTGASSAIKGIHHRMPVILKSEVYEEWLNSENVKIDLDQILTDRIHKDFKHNPVSKAVNSVKNNYADLIAEV